ncbi:MAG: cytochrome b/b6 domain-containing protein, partial [Stellaceae bacterium]
MRRKLVVWDWPTRLFHWAAVVLVAAAYATWRLNWMDWHAWIGEVLLGLVLFRLLWGFFGSDTARFAHFLQAPTVALGHLARALRREPDNQVGHNPAGGWMVLL